MMSFASFIRVAIELCLLTLQDVPSLKSMGILNLECAVLPPGRIEAAIPDVAVARAT